MDDNEMKEWARDNNAVVKVMSPATDTPPFQAAFVSGDTMLVEYGSTPASAVRSLKLLSDTHSDRTDQLENWEAS